MFNTLLFVYYPNPKKKSGAESKKNMWIRNVWIRYREKERMEPDHQIAAGLTPCQSV